MMQTQKKTSPLTSLNLGDIVKFIAHKGQKSKTDGKISCFFFFSGELKISSIMYLEIGSN